jgi:hypothetical protein
MTHTPLVTRTLSTVRELLLVTVLGAVIFGPAAVTSFAQAPAGLPDLVGMLRATPGVLGVDAARTASGKQVIFAWFENKQAALNWFYSDGHQALMKTFTGAGSSGRTPLADIKDERSPILAIASLTLTERPQVEGVKMPISQIAIELYAPLPGGLAVGGRFAPSAMKVPGLVEAPGGR